MTHDHRRLYNALSARDTRFDGVFFVGVTSTGIYCRPICPVKTPKAANCRFFESAAAAEQASFRPCLRCRPELAPGNAPVDDARRIAQLDRTAALGRPLSTATPASRRSPTSSRSAPARSGASCSDQLRRLTDPAPAHPPAAPRQAAPDRDPLADRGGGLRQRIRQPAPVQRRLHPPLRHAAHAGSGEARRPRCRRPTAATPPRSSSPTVRPTTGKASLAFLGRASAGRRRAGHRPRIRPDRAAGPVRKGGSGSRRAPRGDALLLEFTHSLTPALPALLGRVRALFDLDARPDLIRKRLAADPLLAAAVRATPGLGCRARSTASSSACARFWGSR